MFRKICAVFVALCLILPSAGFEYMVKAADEVKYPVVDSVRVTKTYDSGGVLKNKFIIIFGRDLQDAIVRMFNGASFDDLTKMRTINENSMLQYSLTDTDGFELLIAGYIININEQKSPRITSVSPKNVSVQERVTVTGKNLDVVSDTKATLMIGKGGSFEDFTNEFDGDETVIFPKNGDFRLPFGQQDIMYTRTDAQSVKFNLENSQTLTQDVEITLSTTYENQFRLIEKMNLDGIKMYPNRGEVGDRVTFQKDILDNYDIFFMKTTDGTTPFSSENIGKSTTFSSDKDLDDIITTAVPNLPQGEYFVVITNKIPGGSVDYERDIYKEYTLINKFTIISSANKAKIYNIQQNTGSDMGENAYLTGQFLTTMNIADFTVDVGTSPIYSEGKNDTEIIASYTGNYVREDRTQVPAKAARKLSVIVGANVNFNRKADNSFDITSSPSIDQLYIKLPGVSDADIAPTKDVIAEIETTVTYPRSSDGLEVDITFTERVVLTKGYTYIVSNVQPIVESVNPSIVTVNEIAPVSYMVPNDVMVSVKGSNFVVTRDPEGKLIYPTIEFHANNSRILLDKNNSANTGLDPSAPAPDSFQLYVFDSKGNILDGARGRDVGTKILFTIPEGTIISGNPAEIRTNIKVTNPTRNSSSSGLFDDKVDLVKFSTPPAEVPRILNVDPSIISTEGNIKMTITGSNFNDGVRVFIDGEEVKSIKRENNGTTITIDRLPANREAVTQLQVINPDGGMAVYDLVYVKTQTTIKIASSSPSKGTEGTLVTMKGEGFMKPDPNTQTLSGIGIYRLIGTRILMDNTDINSYQLETASGDITFRNYKHDMSSTSHEIATLSDTGGAELKDYAYGLLFTPTGNSELYYRFNVNANGQVEFGDGAENVYTITKIEPNGTIMAKNKVDVEYEIKFTSSDTNDKVEIYSAQTGGFVVAFNAKTLYATENSAGEVVSGEITGLRAVVINSREILFTVPLKTITQWYSLTAINPDTKKDTKEQGFYYSMPLKNPVVTKISPQIGAVSGGYTMVIEGEGFETLTHGNIKTEVYINGVLATNVVVNPSNTQITCTVPKYPTDLSLETLTGRKTVPITVINPSDGGSCSIKDAFTYVVPTSNPTITKLQPNTGNAAGGEPVAIYGTDFRFYEPYSFDKEGIRIFSDLNKNGVWDDYSGVILSQLSEQEKEAVLPVLPKVYFGNMEAGITDYDRNVIHVKTPVNTSGQSQVNVMVVNNDAGATTNKSNFTYTSSKPNISRIVPNKIDKAGNIRAEILGADFSSSSFDMVVRSGDTVATEVYTMPLVRFGAISDPEISNITLPKGDEKIDVNVGYITGAKSKVRVNNLIVSYDGTNADNRILNITAVDTDDQIVADISIPNYNDKAIYVPLSTLKNKDGSFYSERYEMIKITVDSSGGSGRLIVERGYSPNTSLSSKNQIVLRAPSYYTVGETDVTVINPDNGETSNKVTYTNPDSKPTITTIYKEGNPPISEKINGEDVKLVRVNYKGGNTLTVIGTDIREGATLSIGAIKTINYSDMTPTLPSSLTFVVPALTEKEIGNIYAVILQNSDGGSANTEELDPPIYIQITKGETDPSISAITPAMGPSAGGTNVTIQGTDFRQALEGFDGKLEVYFGSVKVEDSDVTIIDSYTINVVTPPNTPGQISVKVQNPDGSLTNPDGDYNYISNPNIIDVVDPTDPQETKKINVLSIEGGESIKIKGSGFIQGARAVFNPVLIPVENATSTGGNIIFIGSNAYRLESGIEAAEVNFLSDDRLVVTTPAGQLDMNGVIVINPDGGASEIYGGLTYILPEIGAPQGKVYANLEFDQYIKVNWSSVQDAISYEIYLVKNDGTPEYLDSTTLTSYIFYDIEPNTRYQFVIKAVGEYGLSKSSEESNIVRTGSRIETPESELDKDTTMTKSGDTVNVIIGLNDFNRQETVIDLTSGDLAGADNVSVSMNAQIITGYTARDIVIKGKDFAVRINPFVFENDIVKRDSGSGVKFNVVKVSNGTDTSSAMSSQYELSADIYQGPNTTSMNSLRSSYMLTLDADTTKASVRRMKELSLNMLENGEWEEIKTENPNVSAISTTTDQLGRFVILGKR